MLRTCKVLAIIVKYYLILNFVDVFSINTQKAHSMKIHPVGFESFHADGWTVRQT
jgi:hypothetical protein